jgi:hypothetical protein
LTYHLAVDDCALGVLILLTASSAGVGCRYVWDVDGESLKRHPGEDGTEGFVNLYEGRLAAEVCICNDLLAV